MLLGITIIPYNTKRKLAAKLTIFIHGRLEAFGQAAGAALIPMRLIYWAASLQVSSCLARINAVAMNAALEKARTTVAAIDAVVLARRSIAAHFARNVQKAIS